MTTIALAAAMGIAAAVALPHVHVGNADCSLFQARLETTETPALEVHVCVMVPSAGSAAIIRYDVGVRVAIMPAPPR